MLCVEVHMNGCPGSQEQLQGRSLGTCKQVVQVRAARERDRERDGDRCEGRQAGDRWACEEQVICVSGFLRSDCRGMCHSLHMYTS